LVIGTRLVTYLVTKGNEKNDKPKPQPEPSVNGGRTDEGSTGTVQGGRSDENSGSVGGGRTE
jgi:hypothetical protein